MVAPAKCGGLIAFAVRAVAVVWVLLSTCLRPLPMGRQMEVGVLAVRRLEAMEPQIRVVVPAVVVSRRETVDQALS